MKKVITYGTYDLLHYGHICLLKRAKQLGDYLIVGVTADSFDKNRGKINVQQSLMERIEAIRTTEIADEIIIEEYEGQKIDDIRRLGIDIFAIGSDWKGKFDYLKDFCEVVYLERTQGISSSDLRIERYGLRFGLAGGTSILEKYRQECYYVNGISVEGIFSNDIFCIKQAEQERVKVFKKYSELLETVEAVYILASPLEQYCYIKEALLAGKHVLCESPVALKLEQCRELFQMAKDRNLILMDAIKTAYATAFNRLLLLAKSGAIGEIISVDATCTSLNEKQTKSDEELLKGWNSTLAWGPTALLPIFQILGNHYIKKQIISRYLDKEKTFDAFTRIDFVYPHAVASLKIGKGVKSEGELIISGTKGYFYVPAPWWKTDYFELRFENPEQNKRYFYQLDGEGIRFELVAFAKAIKTGKDNSSYISTETSENIASIIESCIYKKDIIVI